MRLREKAINFLKKQGFVIVSTLDKDGTIHNACKGIVNIHRDGRIHLLDLYKGRTYANLKRSPFLSITSVDEHHFRGWCLKGKAKILPMETLGLEVIKSW